LRQIAPHRTRLGTMEFFDYDPDQEMSQELAESLDAMRNFDPNQEMSQEVAESLDAMRINMERPAVLNAGADGRVDFLYTGQDWTEIPRNVTHVRIDPSVKVVKGSAFNRCSQLVEVELCEGLQAIGPSAFSDCISLKCIKGGIPSTVRVIDREAFLCCEQLVEAKFREGLRTIAYCAFSGCKGLLCIEIPSTVKVIGTNAFEDCEQLVEVELCEGLIEIASRAFQCCVSLKHLKIPSTVKNISRDCFTGCDQLKDLDLSAVIEARKKSRSQK